MINYSKLSYQIKRKLSTFSKKITKSISRPKAKFVFQMIYGLLESKSVHLSNISRGLNENISLKKTIERISRNLKKFDETLKINENYINEISSYINNDTIFCVDGSEIVKHHTVSFEALDRVRDGDTGKIEDGYNVFEIAALTNEYKMPFSVYSKIYSSKEKDFKSENDETFKGLNFLSEHFGKLGVKALDRGYDDNRFYTYFTEQEESFVIRAKKNRNVIHKGKVINILKLANKYRGKYSTLVKNKEGKVTKCKFSYAPISLPSLPDKKLTLVIVRGFGKIPMMLISDIEPEDKRLTEAIIKVYLKRWRIEEYFRFKKQQFDFEDIRVRSLNSIRTMNLLLSIAIGFIAMLSKTKKENLLSLQILELSKRIYDIPEFDYYALVDGIYAILKKARSGIEKFIPKPLYKIKQSQQLVIFQAFL